MPYYTFYSEELQDGSMNWNFDTSDIAIPIEELGTTFDNNGNPIVTSKKIAEDRNKKIAFNPINGKIKVLTDEEKKEIEQYVQEQKRIDNQRDKNYNVIRSNRLDFINCDRYTDNLSSTPVRYNISVTNNKVNLTSACLIFRESNSYLEFSYMNNSTFQLYNKIPIEEPAELIVIGHLNDDVYFYHKEVKLKRKNSDVITLIKSDYDSIKQKL